MTNGKSYVCNDTSYTLHVTLFQWKSVRKTKQVAQLWQRPRDACFSTVGDFKGAGDFEAKF